MSDLDKYITKEPDEPELPHCPVCGEEAEKFYKDSYGDVAGCENCITVMDSISGQIFPN